eukprot:Nitzschia sp. Nitz4//scaffold303_size22340//573//1104//NITZ4_008564-RA/size22340-snap-gene-0.21-mRNA-1//1//CDS//3329547048//3427//frame0
MFSFKRTVLPCLMAFAALVALSNALDVQTSSAQIYDDKPQSCDTIIAVSEFDGDCCSLNNTDAGGCILNIINGQCIISGQYWSIDWTSTYSAGGATCPPSDYPYLAPASVATEAPDDDSAGALFGSSMMGAAFLTIVAALL